MTARRPRRELHDTGADTVRGIALVNLCFLLLTLGDVATVLALPVMGVVGAMIGRGLVGATLVATVAARQTGGLYLLLPVRWRLVAFRSVVHACASLTWYIAWSWSLGLADSYAVGYAAPLLLPTLNSVGAEIGKPIAPQTASVGVATSRFVRNEGEIIRHNMGWTL
ncbi:MAG TPA: hypothetical protein VFN46_02705, partial [Acetobacteraceae bacterium]|nr:hypothetical protein [Acetobacteraceae bacterium]